MDTASAKPLTWEGQLIIATKGNQSLMGCVVIAILRRAPSNPPRFIYPTARIDADGRLFCPFEDRHGRKWIDYDELVQTPGGVARQPTVDEWKLGGKTFSPGTVIEVRDEMRRLADFCKLSDADRIAFFAEFGKWIERDERANQSSII